MKASAKTRRFVVTIDGPAGSGKSTTARALAAQLDARYIESGALYRAVAWKVKTTETDCLDRVALHDLLHHMDLHVTLGDETTRIFVDSQDVTAYLRDPQITRIASTVAAIPEVRAWLLPVQQRFGQTGDIVAEGRDMGTDVFPDADAKFFLNADLEIRTRRRYQEHHQAGNLGTQDDIRTQIQDRDVYDQSRTLAPLIPAPDAMVIDSSSMTAEEVVTTMLASISLSARR